MEKEDKQNKRMKSMLIWVGILFGAIILYKSVLGIIIKISLSRQSKVVAVSTMGVGYSTWQPLLTASGSLRAIRGVNVTTELAGMVQQIYFTPGSYVKAGDVLVQLNADNDIALLNSLKANAELSRITYRRDQAQFAIKAVSKQVVDADAANLKSVEAQVAQQEAIVAKKSIRAPFDGRLGINQVNPGQFINPGDKVVTLQTLNPIYVDFYMPQQSLAQLKVGQPVVLTTDVFPDLKFTGKITTIDPAVDVSTRNVEVEATIANPENKIAPGMFANVEVIVGQAQQFLTIPQTAVTFNPYGDLVYVVYQKNQKSHGKPVLIVRQHFIVTGETRGEQIKVLKGLQAGNVIVTSGQLKLKNDSEIEINNSIAPSNNPAPVLSNNH